MHAVKGDTMMRSMTVWLVCTGSKAGPLSGVHPVCLHSHVLGCNMMAVGGDPCQVQQFEQQMTAAAVAGNRVPGAALIPACPVLVGMLHIVMYVFMMAAPLSHMTRT